MTNTELTAKLQKTLDFLEQEIAQVRTGRATPALLENIAVEAYDSKMTIQELGSITLLDSQTLLVSTWDKSLMNAVAAAIRDSDLKLNPVIDGAVIRVPIPSLTEERRKEFAKVVSTKVEDSKNALRNGRQEAMKDIEKEFTEKKIGEDEKFSKKDVVEEIVKDFVARADALGEAKKADLLKI